jgi:hypothetical protein
MSFCCEVPASLATIDRQFDDAAIQLLYDRLPPEYKPWWDSAWFKQWLELAEGREEV